LRLFRWCVC